MFRMSIVLIVAILSSTSLTWAQSPSPSPTDVARSYLQALDDNNLDVAGSLFVERSSVFESGGDEGTWDHYRDHHLQPEVDAIASFQTTLGEPDEISSVDGSMAVVTWPIEYHVALNDNRSIDSKGVVTFVLVWSDEAFLIKHLHWSSRRKKE